MIVKLLAPKPTKHRKGPQTYRPPPVLMHTPEVREWMSFRLRFKHWCRKYGFQARP